MRKLKKKDRGNGNKIIRTYDNTHPIVNKIVTVQKFTLKVKKRNPRNLSPRL